MNERNLNARVKRLERRDVSPIVCTHYINAPYPGSPIPETHCICEDAKAKGINVVVIEIEYTEDALMRF